MNVRPSDTSRIPLVPKIACAMHGRLITVRMAHVAATTDCTHRLQKTASSALTHTTEVNHVDRHGVVTYM